MPVWFIVPHVSPSHSSTDEEAESEALPKRKKRKKEKKYVESEIDVVYADEEDCREAESEREEMESLDEGYWEVFEFLSDDTFADEGWKL